jgi:anti-sigma factor RsiW
LGRPGDQHIDSEELNALVSSASEAGPGAQGLSATAVQEAEDHVRSCVECSRKVSKYRQLLSRSVQLGTSGAAAPGPDCPKPEDVDWPEVAAGLWPELKAQQLIRHAAFCDHCGPLLRAATPVDDPTPEEERLLAGLKAPSRPLVTARANPASPGALLPQSTRWRFLQWKFMAPALALLVIVGVLTTRPSSPKTLSGPSFMALAVRTHKLHAQGDLALDVRSDSQQTLNAWLNARSRLALTLPVPRTASGEEQPYRLEGARLMQVGGKTAAYVAYRMPTGPVSLMVTPDSVAVASGGVEVDSPKLSLHYSMVEGFKVVTWSVHGLTYALVSQEGNSTQRSCMVCHSAIGDRDLSQTPTPLHADKNAADSVWQ